AISGSSQVDLIKLNGFFFKGKGLIFDKDIVLFQLLALEMPGAFRVKQCTGELLINLADGVGGFSGNLRVTVYRSLAIQSNRVLHQLFLDSQVFRQRFYQPATLKDRKSVV